MSQEQDVHRDFDLSGVDDVAGLSRNDVGASMATLGRCLQQWQAARHDGESLLARLSNALLLRTYVRRGRGHRPARVWGALADAGDAVAKVSQAAETRIHRLHSDLAMLQQKMVDASVGIKRCAVALRHQSITRRCIQPDTTSSGEEEEWKAVGGAFGLEDAAATASVVADMLMKEAIVTATIVRSIEDCGEDREALTMYSAAWIMRPYLDGEKLDDLQTMIGKQ